MLAPQANDHPFLFDPQNTNETSHNTTPNKTAHNYYKSWNTMPPLRLNSAADDDSPSGVCSPPLWKTTTTGDEGCDTQSVNIYRNLSPASRRQAIVRGQREMMEMVRNMPESCYELSLKDLVERPRMVADNEDEHCDTIGFKVKQTKKKAVVRSRSSSTESGGFLLKMVFPVSLGSFKKKKKNDKMVMKKNEKNNGDIISREMGSIDEKGGSRPNCVDTDWWKRRVSESGRSESCGSSVVSGSIKSSSGSSTNSSTCSSRSNSIRRKTVACWSFIVLKKKRQE